LKLMEAEFELRSDSLIFCGVEFDLRKGLGDFFCGDGELLRTMLHGPTAGEGGAELAAEICVLDGFGGTGEFDAVGIEIDESVSLRGGGGIRDGGGGEQQDSQ